MLCSEEGCLSGQPCGSAPLSDPWATSTCPSQWADTSFCICSELLFQPHFYLKQFRGKPGSECTFFSKNRHQRALYRVKSDKQIFSSKLSASTVMTRLEFAVITPTQLTHLFFCLPQFSSLCGCMFLEMSPAQTPQSTWSTTVLFITSLSLVARCEVSRQEARLANAGTPALAGNQSAAAFDDVKPFPWTSWGFHPHQAHTQAAEGLCKCMVCLFT